MKKEKYKKEELIMSTQRFTPVIPASLLLKRKRETTLSDRLDLPLFSSNPVNKEIYKGLKERRKQLQTEAEDRAYLSQYHSESIKEIDYLIAKIKGPPPFRFPRNKKLRTVCHRLIALREHIVKQYI